MNRSPAAINGMVDSRDPDDVLGYLSLVNGIDGAILYNREGLVVAFGEDTHRAMFAEGPYLLSGYIESLESMEESGFGIIQSQVNFGVDRFYQIFSLDHSKSFFLMVSGTRGSHELYRIRMERACQALSCLLRDNGFT